MKYLSWKVVVLATAMMVCGTALYIYNGLQTELQKQNQPSPAMSQQVEDRPVPVPDFKTLVPVESPTIKKPLRMQTDDITHELQRANDIAERTEWQRRMDAIDAHAQAFDQQQAIDDIGFQLELQRLQSPQLPPSQPSDWILKYNYFNNTWRYEPPNASLEYNPMENDWEFVH